MCMAVCEAFSTAITFHLHSKSLLLLFVLCAVCSDLHNSSLVTAQQRIDPHQVTVGVSCRAVWACTI